MTNILTVDGKEYVPATDAGIYFGYSKDYILMLIKQGKIDGQKIGNKWYANLPSGISFFKAAEAERELRLKKISFERKAELKSHTKTRIKTHSNVALLETLVIVVIGLSIGTTGYIGTTANLSSVSDGSSSFLENLAISFYNFISPAEKHVTQNSYTNVQSDDVNSVGTTTYTSLVVAPDELFTTTTVESIQDSFSDEVEVSVDPENPKTGIIIPVFKNSKSESYRFLMVPVKADTQ